MGRRRWRQPRAAHRLLSAAAAGGLWPQQAQQAQQDKAGGQLTASSGVSAGAVITRWMVAAEASQNATWYCPLQVTRHRAGDTRQAVHGRRYRVGGTGRAAVPGTAQQAQAGTWAVRSSPGRHSATDPRAATGRPSVTGTALCNRPTCCRAAQHGSSGSNRRGAAPTCSLGASCRGLQLSALPASLAPRGPSFPAAAPARPPRCSSAAQAGGAGPAASAPALKARRSKARRGKAEQGRGSCGQALRQLHAGGQAGG